MKIGNLKEDKERRSKKLI